MSEKENQAHSRKDAEPVNDDLAINIECIDARYRGDLSYEHDAYYMRKAAANMIRNGYKLYASPPEADKLLQQALEALDSCGAYPSGITWVDLNKTTNAATAIRTYLENKA